MSKYNNDPYVLEIKSPGRDGKTKTTRYSVTDAATAAVFIRSVEAHMERWRFHLFDYGRFSVVFRYNPAYGDREPVLQVKYRDKDTRPCLSVTLGEVKTNDFRWYQKFSPARMHKARKEYRDPNGYLKTLWDYVKAFGRTIDIVTELKYHGRLR